MILLDDCPADGCTKSEARDCGYCADHCTHGPQIIEVDCPYPHDEGVPL